MHFALLTWQPPEHGAAFRRSLGGRHLASGLPGMRTEFSLTGWLENIICLGLNRALSSRLIFQLGAFLSLEL
jgi:hypothetical protein